MRLALLSNVTVDLLAGMLKKNMEVYLPAGYDTWQQELMVQASGLYKYNPEAVVVLLYANAYADVWNDMEKGCRMIDEWHGVLKTFMTNLPEVPVYVSSIDVSNVECRFGAEIRFDQFFENYMTERIQELHNTGRNIYILPVQDAVSNLGRLNFYASKMWYMGSMPYSMKGLAALNSLIIRYVSAVKGTRKKCLAVDLDYTLWGGVISEDGIGGIVLSNNKEGARYKDTQRIIKKMKDQGVMIAVLSKNNREDVEPVFAHPDMILQHEDFVAEVINWEPKSVNIRKLAMDLNIGLDAFVFLDDNPVEREQMKAECPEVAVIDFPKDSSQLPAVVARVYDDYFFSLEVTAEDTRKTVMYRAEADRRVAFDSSSTVEDFLKKLEMTMDIHYMVPDEKKRVTQLVNKTNQFNVTTKRYCEEEICRLAAADDSDVVTVHMFDKYGDQGLVAVVILTYEREAACIDTFLMSCRVMGRKAENEIMAQLKKLLENKDVKTVRAAYIKTAKNTPVQELYDQLGFSLISKKAQEIDGRKDYEARTADLPDITGIFKTTAFGVRL